MVCMAADCQYRPLRWRICQQRIGKTENNYCGPSFGAVLFGLREYGPKIGLFVATLSPFAAVAMNAMWITANAYGSNSSDSSDSSSSSTDSGVTITENITDTENLLGSHAAEVTDAIAKTEKETGVHVHLLYLSSFNSQQKPGDWAATVMESMNPKPNTVMLAVASNDGNLVVVVSKNSDKWLLDNKTVDKLSEAAQQPLLENPPSWSGAATAMMDQIVKSKKLTHRPR